MSLTSLRLWYRPKSARRLSEQPLLGDSIDDTNGKYTRHERRAIVRSQHWKARRTASLVALLLVLYLYAPRVLSAWYAASGDSVTVIEAGRIISEASRQALEAARDTAYPHPPPVIGERTRQITLAKTDMHDSITGEDLSNRQGGGASNLSLLKLPPGSKWDFFGVARAPIWLRDFSFGGRPVTETAILAMGLNMSADGALQVVTRAETLELRTHLAEKCKGRGADGYISFVGAEDGKLFWTDSGTPAMMYGRVSTQSGHCRSMAFIEDMRDIWAPLHEAMVPGSSEFAALWSPARRIPGLSESRELIRLAGQDPNIEKNWSPFYPGAWPQAKQTKPSLHYGLVPKLAMQPSFEDVQAVHYVDVVRNETRANVTTFRDVKNGFEASCLTKRYPQTDSRGHHHAGPLYRLTLCPRGDCAPDPSNTVLFGLAHHLNIHNKGKWNELRSYSKYTVAMNVSTFEFVSVGGVFQLNGLDDDKTMSFLVGMVPLPSANQAIPLQGPAPRSSKWSFDRLLNRDRTPELAKSRALTHPGHLWLDDEVLVTLGYKDEEMRSTRVPMRDLLVGHQMCESEESSRG